MRLITPQFSWFYYLLLLSWFLPATRVIAGPSEGAASAPSVQHVLLSDLFDEHYVVDTHVNPRLWFGCCNQIAVCAGDSAWKNPMCHRLSKPLNERRLQIELGANVVFTPVALNQENNQRLLLPAALLNSNQLGDKPNRQTLLRMYVAELDFERLSDFSSIKKWSKYLHLAGGRGVRFRASAALTVDRLDRGQVMKSLGLIFGRYFIVDVGGLSPALIELVLKYTSPRKLPVLMSGVHFGDGHACNSVDQSKGFDPKQLCEVVSSGGIITIGPNLDTVGSVPTECDTVDAVNGYVFSQFEGLSQLTCDGQSPEHMQAHLAVRSNLPLLDVVDPKRTPKFIHSRWGRFTHFLSKRSVPIDAITGLLGENMVRFMRRALPGVQPAHLLFPVGHQSLTGDKGIQFQWVPPKKNDPKGIAGQIFGMRRASLVIQRRLGSSYEPWQTVKIISGDRKSLKVKPGNFRWRLVSTNRQSRVRSDWGYFSVTDTDTDTLK